MFGQKKCLFGSKTVFLGQEVHYYMVYIAYFTELILQICDYAQKRRIWRENCKYAFDENFHCHFCSRRKAAKFCHPGINASSALGPQSSTWQNITSTLRWQKLAPQKVKWGNLIEWICDRCHLYLWSLDLLKFMFIEPPVQRIVIKAITMYCKGALEEEENFFKFLYLLSLCRCAEFSSQSSSFSVDCDVTGALTGIPS